MTKKTKIWLTLILLVIGVLVIFILKETQKSTVFPDNDSTSSLNRKNFSAQHPDSILNMAEKNFSGSDLQLERVLDENNIYTRYFITYRSEGLTISGIMNIPKGEGPFPVLILNHGYIPPENYTNGQGLKREQDFFARNGYAVLHSDYRNYARSDFDPENDFRPRAGFVEDVINAVNAVKNSDIQTLDKENIGMLGHSLGGGITINTFVIKPEIAKAYVLLAPINADYRANFERWVRNDWSDISERFEKTYGTYQENPKLWEGLSARNYFDRISSPILLHQGALDQDVPVEWSRGLNEDLKRAGKNITYYEYPAEPHTFINAQDLVMQRTLDFFDQYLK